MKQEEKLVHRIEIDEAIVGLRADGIIHVYYKPHTEINIPLQEKMLNILDEITNGVKTSVIYQAGEYCTVTKEAREYAIAIEHLSPTRASVVYVKNLAQRMIAEFYYKFNKPKQPYKVVSDFDEGIKWLLGVEKEIEDRSRF